MSSGSSKSGASTWIMTSLVPADPQAQADAVRSWAATGLPILSVNHPDEISALTSDPDIAGLPIEFMPTSHVATDRYGKPFVYLDNYLQLAVQNRLDRFVLLNSDVVLADPEALHALLETSGYAVALSHRVDVNATTGDQVPYANGFDLFVIGRAAWKCLVHGPFALGVPYVDYWIALMSILAGLPVVRTVEPLVRHINHPKNWSFETYAKADFFFHQGLMAALDSAPPDRVARLAAPALMTSVMLRPGCLQCAVDVVQSLNTSADGRGLRPNQMLGILSTQSRVILSMILEGSAVV